MIAAQHSPCFDLGFVGHIVRVYIHGADYSLTFPPVTDAGLAADLAGLLGTDLSGADVSVMRCGCFSGQRHEADEVTASIARRLAELGNTERPGIEFLRRIGYFGDQPTHPRA